MHKLLLEHEETIFQVVQEEGVTGTSNGWLERPTVARGMAMVKANVGNEQAIAEGVVESEEHLVVCLRVANFLMPLFE